MNRAGLLRRAIQADHGPGDLDVVAARPERVFRPRPVARRRSRSPERLAKTDVGPDELAACRRLRALGHEHASG